MLLTKLRIPESAALAPAAQLFRKRSVFFGVLQGPFFPDLNCSPLNIVSPGHGTHGSEQAGSGFHLPQPRRWSGVIGSLMVPLFAWAGGLAVVDLEALTGTLPRVLGPSLRRSWVAD